MNNQVPIPHQPELKKSKLPKYNKPRLVFAVDSKGEAISYIHLEKYQVDVILDTIELMQRLPSSELQKTKGWIVVRDLYDKLKKSYPMLSYRTYHSNLILMAGSKFIDMKNEDNKHERIMTTPVYLSQSMHHHKLNLNIDNTKIPHYLKGTRYMCLAQSP